MQKTIKETLNLMKDEHLAKMFLIIEHERDELKKIIPDKDVDFIIDSISYAIMINESKELCAKYESGESKKIMINYMDILLSIGELAEDNTKSPEYFQGVYDSLSAIRRLKDKLLIKGGH